MASKHATALLGIAFMIAVGIVLRCNHLMDVTSRSPDERTYTFFAQQIATDGFGAIPKLFKVYVSRKELWDFPPPVRITYPIIGAVVMVATGWKDFDATVAVSFVSSCLSLFVLAWIGLRFFNPWMALAAVTFLAFSVSELGSARRAWQDCTFGLFGLLLMYVTCELTRDPRRPLWYLVFFVLGALSLLTKQTGLISYGLCALWALWVFAVQERYWRGTAFLILGGLASLAATLAIWSLAAGGVDTAISALDHSFHPGDAAIFYMKSVTSGPWYQFFDVLWLTGPFPAVMAAVGAAAIICGRTRSGREGDLGSVIDERAAICAMVLALGFVSFAGFFPYMQSLRFITPANGAYCLIAALGLCYLLGLAKENLPALLSAAVFLIAIGTILVTSANDYDTFKSVVVRSGMQDLAAVPIRQRAGRD